MLGSIRKLLSTKLEARRKHRLQMVDFDGLPDNPSLVTNPNKILKLLRQVMAATPLSTVTLGNSSEVFYTSILEVQAENGLFIIDKISPAYGNSALLAGGEFKLTALVSGVQVSFTANLVAHQQIGTLDCYQAYLPTQVFHPQQRASPRIATKSTAISFQGTIKNTGRLLKGYITDISRGGASITCVSFAEGLKRGDTLSDCRIRLSNNQVLSFDLSIRTLKRASYIGQQRQIGGYFHNLPAPDQKILDHYVTALEREEIRKLRKD